VVNVTSIAGLTGAPVRRRRLCHLEGRARSVDPRGWRSISARVGVRVNSIAPGEIDTSILSPGTEKIVEQQIPMHRLGTPDEVAKIIYVLCTEDQLLRERRRDPHQWRPARVARSFSPLAGARLASAATCETHSAFFRQSDNGGQPSSFSPRAGAETSEARSEKVGMRGDFPRRR